MSKIKASTTTSSTAVKAVKVLDPNRLFNGPRLKEIHAPIQGWYAGLVAADPSLALTAFGKNIAAKHNTFPAAIQFLGGTFAEMASGGWDVGPTKLVLESSDLVLSFLTAIEKFCNHGAQVRNAAGEVIYTVNHTAANI